MSQQQETRPFNLEHAKAGAPYACRNGSKAEVLKWDARSERYPLVGVRGENDEACTWAENGKYDLYQVHNQSSDLLMTSLGEIDGKPVFVGDKVEVASRAIIVMPHDRDFSRCRWPASEKQYPVTGMTDRQFSTFYTAGGRYVSDMRAAANAALRHAIDSGTVVVPTVAQAQEIDRQAAAENFPPSRIRRFMPYAESPEGIANTNRAARDMAIAEAVAKATYNQLYTTHRVAYCDIGLDLAAIVAEVP